MDPIEHDDEKKVMAVGFEEELAIYQRDKRLLSAHLHYVRNRETILKKKRAIEKHECPHCEKKFVRWYLKEHIERKHSEPPTPRQRSVPPTPPPIREYRPVKYTADTIKEPTRPMSRPRKTQILVQT